MSKPRIEEVKKMTLQRKLGFSAVLAVVMGDMIGSGIFFTPGELAAVASSEWQVYFFWAVCGFITLCGALTLAELATLMPKAGVSYHALNEAYGPFAGFMQAWMMVLVSGPGAIAGVAILFGELANHVFGGGSSGMQFAWATGAIFLFAIINLRGAQWGGRTQVFLTTVKVTGLAALIFGGVILAEPAISTNVLSAADESGSGLTGLLRFIGLGVAIVLFTYDGWIDASHIAGEVRNPGRNFPMAMGIGVLMITCIYMLVNYAFLRVVPLDAMRANPTMVAPTVAEAAFGPAGGIALSVLMWISIFGALGGLIMTLPRLFYAAASDYQALARGTRLAPFFNGMSHTSANGVPSGAILFAGGVSIVALLFFGSFSRIVTFFVVPFQFMNILMVSTIFRLRSKLSRPDAYQLPGYPLVPAIFIFVMSLFMLAALFFNPLDSIIGIVLTALGAPVYRILARRRQKSSND